MKGVNKGQELQVDNQERNKERDNKTLTKQAEVSTKKTTK